MINQELVFHHAQYPWLFIEETSSCRILLALPAGQDLRVFIRYGDPFDFLPGTDKQPNLKEAEMALERSEGKQDFYVCTIKLFTHKLRYHFRLETAEEICWYGESGLLDRENETLLRPFFVPYLFQKEQYCPPHWTGETVWYQIFPDRFADSRQRNDPSAFIPDRTNFFGGDLRGIMSKIPYLKETGGTGVYLTPVFQSTSNHRYDTQDYLKVDPALGTEEDLAALCDALHASGIKCMLDGVYNHAGWACPQWQDVLAHAERSEYKDWFYIYDMGRTQALSLADLTSEVMKRDPPYEAFAFAANMPKWNTENPAVQEYLIGSAEFWTKRLNLDGWRLDVPDEVSASFLRAFRRRIKAIRPEIYITGEIWGSPDRWLQGDMFDGAMNYPMYFILRDFTLLGLDDAYRFASRMNRYLLSTPPQVRQNMLLFIANHDLPRPLTLSKGECNAVLGALLLLSMLEGEICLYYGDEMSMAGGEDPDNRRPMVWQDNCEASNMRIQVQSLLSLRKETHDYRKGTQIWQAIAPTIVMGTWQKEGHVLTAYVHNGDFATSVCLNKKSVISLGNARLEGKNLVLPPHGMALVETVL